MKIAVRIFAIACVAAVAFAGNSLPRSATAPIVQVYPVTSSTKVLEGGYLFG